MQINSEEEYLKIIEAVKLYENKRRKSYDVINKKATDLLNGYQPKWLLGGINGMENYTDDNFFYVDNGIAKHWDSLTIEEQALLRALAHIYEKMVRI